MKYFKLIVAGLLISSLFGYLEWGDNNTAFIFETEYAIFSSSKDSASAFVHPVILLPFIGQLILVFCLIKKRPNIKLTLVGVILLSLLLLLILLVGILGKNFKIIISTIPFLILSSLFITKLLKNRKLKH